MRNRTTERRRYLLSLSLRECRRFLKLPKEERERILSEQAEKMVDFYENDTEWREWLAGPIIEYEIP